MALQDLTPQLRTRLRKVEWVVALFLLGAVALGLVGLGFFIKTTGDRRGWWVRQVPYYTYLRDGGSVKVGTPVKMLGFTIGEVVQIDTAPDDPWHRDEGFNVFVRFLVRDPYHGYIFTDSLLKVAGLPIDIAGGNFLEVTRSQGLGIATTAPATNAPGGGALGVLWDKYAYHLGRPDATNFIRYDPVTKDDKGYFLRTEVTGDLVGELTLLVPRIREAFTRPGGLGDLLFPTNLSARFDRPGGLGDIMIPTNLSSALTVTLTNLNAQIGGIGSLVSNVDASVPALVTNLNATLPPLLSELGRSVPPLVTQVNQQIRGVGPLVSNLDATLPGALGEVRKTLGAMRSNTLPAAEGVLTNTSDFVGGLKRHWLFRGAFKTNTPPRRP
ncbi:MAG: MCE family protein [Verrucomicrobia bacterium]|nr:MCE family protein [Verrucomicrobiota bacterium]